MIKLFRFWLNDIYYKYDTTPEPYRFWNIFWVVLLGVLFINLPNVIFEIIGWSLFAFIGITRWLYIKGYL